jgi:adenosine deaminase
MDLRDLRGLPKVDLHRHLEGSIRLSTIVELSLSAGIPLPADTPHGLAPHALVTRPVKSLEEALRAFSYAQNAVRTLDSVRRIAVEAVEDLASENVRLAELRFSPDFLCGPGDLDRDGAMEAIADGVGEAGERCDVAVGVIAIFSRDLGERSGRGTVAFALRHRDRLVGFDIAGPEVGYPPARYRSLLEPLRGSGLGLTTHYGESGGPEYPREAVEVLGPARLGHGLTVARDPAVVDLVIERAVTLEMCPWSNWLTGGVERVEDHPARRLLDAGVLVTLNSDDPGLFGTDLTRDFEVARDALGFDEDRFRRVTENSIRASFLPPDVKARVRTAHFGWLDRRD